jgi:hypothetical protein
LDINNKCKLYRTSEDSEWGINESPQVTIELEPGDTVTCTFENTKLPKLTVEKVIVPGNDAGKFNLFIDRIEVASNVGNGGSGSEILDLGERTVTETAGTETDLSNYTATYSENCIGGKITLGDGDDKTCTITNTRKGTIIVEKQTIPDEDQEAVFTFSGDAAGVISDGQQIVVNNLVPGTYTSQNHLEWMDVTNITCTDSDKREQQVMEILKMEYLYLTDPGRQ